MILFILTQHDSDVIIVDQPEDDLDNQVIYEELIQTIKKEKEDMQFIFATHNANIPVLGDAERVITVQHNDDESIKLKCGTIDSEETHSDIVLWKKWEYMNYLQFLELECYRVFCGIWL